jgi:ABC-type sugar transport system permease subunit
MGYASAVAYLMFAIVFALTLLQTKYLKRSIHYTL